MKIPVIGIALVALRREVGDNIQFETEQDAAGYTVTKMRKAK